MINALMRKYGIISCVCMMLALMAVSCGHRPSNVLAEDKMVKLMADMEIAEAYATSQSSSSEYRIELGREVLEAHGVSEETLDTTLAWYGRNMDEYKNLFEKVDKEIQKRRDKYTDNPFENGGDLTNLWPYSRHLEINSRGGREALVFSIDNPSIRLGEIVNMDFAMSAPSGGKGLLGLEYTDGSGEASTATFTNKKNYHVDVQTDTLKSLARIYGVVSFKDLKGEPLYLDSISITVLPIDSTGYRQKKRFQKAYGIMKEREIVVKKDTIPSDSLAIEPIPVEIDSLPKRSTPNGVKRQEINSSGLGRK